MSVQAAIEAPRVRPHGVESRHCRSAHQQRCAGRAGARGHLMELLPDFSMAFGGAQGIMIDPDSGAFTGGADPRRDGYAVGW